MSDDETKVTRSDITVHPTKTVAKSENFGTLYADYAKVTTTENLQMCTFTFFQSHPIPTLSDKGLLLDRVEDEKECQYVLAEGSKITS